TPRRLALAPLEKPQQADWEYSEHARERERPEEHAHDVRAHAREQEEMDGGRKTQHRDQRRTDRDADLAPTQRRTHARAAVIHIRYHGSAPSPGIPVLRAPLTQTRAWTHSRELRLFFPRIDCAINRRGRADVAARPAYCIQRQPMSLRCYRPKLGLQSELDSRKDKGTCDWFAVRYS